MVRGRIILLHADCQERMDRMKVWALPAYVVMTRTKVLELMIYDEAD